MEDKVKSKSIEDSAEYYEKINDKIPLPEEHPTTEEIQQSYLDKLTTPFTDPFMTSKLHAHEQKHQINNPSIVCGDKLKGLKQSFEVVSFQLQEFKRMFFDYICDEYCQRTECDILIINKNTIYFYIEMLNQSTATKLTKLTDKWTLYKNMDNFEYNFKIIIKLGE